MEVGAGLAGLAVSLAVESGNLEHQGVPSQTDPPVGGADTFLGAVGYGSQEVNAGGDHCRRAHRGARPTPRTALRSASACVRVRACERA